MTAIDAKTGDVAGTVPLGGKPEFPVTDGKGNVYVNIEDKSEIVQFDPKTLEIKNHWALGPQCDSPSGLAIDTKSRRLFPVCDNKVMAIVDADSGKVITTVPTGEGTDAAGFDPGTKLAFASNGERHADGHQRRISGQIQRRRERENTARRADDGAGSEDAYCISFGRRIWSRPRSNDRSAATQAKDGSRYV